MTLQDELVQVQSPVSLEYILINAKRNIFIGSSVYQFSDIPLLTFSTEKKAINYIDNLIG